MKTKSTPIVRRKLKEAFNGHTVDPNPIPLPITGDTPPDAPEGTESLQRFTGITKLIPFTRPLTKKLARTYYNMPLFPGDRLLDEERLRSYQEQHERGIFRTPSWAEAKCRATGKTYRMNGKHTSTMFHRMPVIPACQRVFIEKFICDTMEDMAMLYATFDSKEGARSVREVNMTFAATQPALVDVKYPKVGALVGGIALHKTENRSAMYAIKIRDRAPLLATEKEFVDWYVTLMNTVKCPTQKFVKYPIISGMLATWKSCPRDATRFWTDVIEVSNKVSTSTTYLLHDFVRHLVIVARKPGDYPKGEEILRYPMGAYADVIRFWNAWMSGKPAPKMSKAPAPGMPENETLPAVL